ncbi:ROK family transcriptional regulator [Limosilactobacillus sp. STM2_1]|uniref:ROK family transcriptional regulator n=1 Tax=Limosilactobacillus rudii TaxID=2759755 RepID=A0A7W3UM76_9LACO|nr:ROK family transcriptional regulator [Limosilactobacillus rudii]MBB1079983.1 ROK family transcriptional regulator [Limosilactobacillus rudii]MBB1098061.1 ROK family transcriptional regulator [Limosilactobacillus rudii]MCD7135131.1 ROK family transcriptional regulator [Limosilactobacillus rudii]
MINDHRNLSRIQNKKQVLQQLFNNKETSRAEIARQLNLNKSTVSSIYDELNSEGFIEGVRQGDSTSNGGRKPHLVRLNYNYGFVASFNIGTSYMAAMFNYLNGEIIQYNRAPIEKFDILNIMQMIKEEISKLQSVDTTQHGLLAIAFSIHGIVFNDKVIDSPFLELQGIDLAEYFSNEFGVPVVLENEANLSAVFEQDFGVNQDTRNLITISIHRGIGVGIIADHKLYRGYRGMAGEIGRSLMTNDLDNGSRQLVKVESLCSEDAIIRQVMNAKDLSELSSAELIKLYHEDDQVKQILNHAAELIAEASYNAIVSYGPEKIYFNSTLFEDIPELYKMIRDKLSEFGIVSPIQMIEGSRMTSLLGASSLAIHRALGLDNYLLHFKWPKEVNNVD